MLDADTKRRIDTCRNILVGKVPDPKSQVEQITIALIYKFMDDMDAEAEELGGKRTFFAGEYARFGWAKLMAPSLGGFEVLALYTEAIATMNANPGVPELFRDIFKNAYLPYRDPETLKSFLKEINTFTYDHSERLGDAFEYLLSVLGSQGDAGQFRTPRHVIDFMVAVLDPKKDESILDPACGTAGFLISAWKHILRQNSSAQPVNGGTPSGDRLTLDERARLAANIRGYDISPDMVRLSLVNLYLHGFAEPHVLEYDTLTQDERWNEVADVILANPPFMSPKGGIKPHKRFSVQSSRSEVLFVDYMAEHLSATGRAAIVVPEGIIFQSGTAYKALRKMLVENCLVAVVSLPAGVFNPYSGVKTSILILDKRVHKQIEQVLFVKVQADGYNLGAQRRAVAANDLPEAQRLLRGWMEEPQSFSIESGLAQAVARTRIAESGDFNLSVERHLVRADVHHNWRVTSLGEICTKITDGSHNPPEKQEAGELMLSSQNVFNNELNLSSPRWITLEDFEKENKRTEVSPGDVLLTIVGTIGRSLVVNDRMPRFALQRSVAVLKPKIRDVSPDYLCRILQSEQVQSVLAVTAKGVAQKGVYLNALRAVEIPLPPLEVQQQIVAEIEGYQKVIDGARQVLEYYQPHIAIDPAWPTVPLGEIFKTKSGTTPSRSNPAYFEGGEIPWVKTLDLNDGALRVTDECVTDLALADTHLEKLPAGTVLVAMYGGFNQIGRTGVLEIEATLNQAMTALLPSSQVDPYFLNAVLVSRRGYWKSVANSTRKDPNITKSDVLNFPLPLPDLAAQRAIVAEIEAEQALVAANRELITRMEAKIRAVMDRVWGTSSAKSG